MCASRVRHMSLCAHGDQKTALEVTSLLPSLHRFRGLNSGSHAWKTSAFPGWAAPPVLVLHSFFCVCMNVYHVCAGPHRDKKKWFKSLELELEAIVSHPTLVLSPNVCRRKDMQGDPPVNIQYIGLGSYRLWSHGKFELWNEKREINLIFCYQKSHCPVHRKNNKFCIRK